ncbi:hypothetical protein OGAPHI_005974 [Ogataea philodendri]|uniref:Dipeptidyl peptidase 3 n=1 Tax=Ogataea philodendri TaxID=1378263 RepID=A0A9P8NYX2_9ASCO|nr:uncharacterized protein OGAPHI_005974 [Ogataea philodendri]KAH3661796.1 hypothetical protein OGAPHI_005974 [Ogataea philodendri]
MTSTSAYYADSGAPIARLSAKQYFDQLTNKEKLYAHYMSKAGFWGTRVVLRSVSPESEQIYDLILSIHKALKGDYSILEKHLGKEAKTGYLEYASQFLSNLGNYRSFGDSKFIPRLNKGDFETFIELINDEYSLQLFEQVKDDIYSVDSQTALLGWPANGHVSGYYLNAVTKDEVEAINSALASKSIMPENTRLEKLDDFKFRVHVASANISNSTGYYPDTIDFELAGKPASLEFKFGDHAAEFGKIVENLVEAKKHVANETQLKMLENYIESFQTGSMKAHYQSQIHWVKDIGPAVETNVGFIETYREPSNVRGEWECLVAMVNKSRTAKFGQLVSQAKEFIALLPWTKDYEKDVFTPPDFTSLEVLSMTTSSVPSGINLPNYDKVRINLGFKNVSLGNAIGAGSGKEPITFVADDIQDIYRKYRTDAFEVQVGIHELLGHGSGKLLMESDDGEFNFDVKNPPLGLDGKPVTTYYKKGETWGSLFGYLAGGFEECRAESVAMSLFTNRKLLEIFGFTEKSVQDDLIGVSYLTMVRAGLLGMEHYDPANKKWNQPHCQARFAILKTLLEAGEGLVTLEYTKQDYSDLVIKVDRSKIETVGQAAVDKFLNKLHVYKCSADVKNGSKFFQELTTPGPDLLKFRDIILAKKLPRRQLVQANTILKDDEVTIEEYSESELGMIESYIARDT